MSASEWTGPMPPYHDTEGAGRPMFSVKEVNHRPWERWEPWFAAGLGVRLEGLCRCRDRSCRRKPAARETTRRSRGERRREQKDRRMTAALIAQAAAISFE